MKLTPDILSSKLGKRVDIPNIEELSLPSMGFVDVSSFARLKSLKTLDLSGNRFQLVRHIKGLFDLPAITNLNLTGNPVTKQSLYRMTVIHYLPTLEILDEKTIIDTERARASTFDPENASKDPLSKSAQDDDDEDEEQQNEEEQQNDNKSTDTTPTKKQSSTIDTTEENKKNKFDEDSLFGPSKTKEILFEKDEEISLDSINLADLEKKPVPKKQQPSKISFLEDDDDDIFKSSKPIQSKPTTTSKFDLDDDLFGDSKSSGGGKSTLSSDFDISTYIQSQKNRSKGGLFD